MRNFSMIIKILFVFILIVPLGGCWDRQDPENMAFVVAVGVDKGPENDYLFTFAVAVPKPLGGDSQSSGGNKSMVVHTVEGSNIVSAILASQSFIARKLTLLHSKVFIVGEGLAKDGVMPVLSEVVRSREFRRSFYVMTTHGTAKEYIRNIKPTTESDISLWFELELDPDNMGSMIPINSRFHDFITDIEKGGGGAVTIQTAYREDLVKGNADLPVGTGNTNGKQPIVGEQNAGEIRRVGESPVEFFGSAIYKDDKLIGFLNGHETKNLNMLRGDFERTTWDFSDPADEKLNLTIDMKVQKEGKIKVKRRKNKVMVTFDIELEGDLISVQSDRDYTKKKNRRLLEQTIEKTLKEESEALLDKFLHEWEVECFRINDHVKATFSTLKEWEDYKWKEHIKDIDYKMNIKFNMRGYGDVVGSEIKGDEIQ